MKEFTTEKNLDERISKLNKITRLCGMGRLVLALLIVVFLLCMVTTKNYDIYGYLSLGFIAILALFSTLTMKFYREERKLKNCKTVHRHHSLRRNGEYYKMTDTGAEFLEKEDYKESDLDLFGKRSLFQFLSSAATRPGRKKLAQVLKNGQEKGKDYPTCLKKMAESEDILDLEASLEEFRGIGEAAYETLTNLKSEEIRLKWYHFLPPVLYLCNIAYLICALVLKLNPYYAIPAAILIYIVTRLCERTPLFGTETAGVSGLLEAYKNLCWSLGENPFEDPVYDALKGKILSKKKMIYADAALFTRLASRKNILFNILLNVLCVYDFFILLSVRRIIKKAGSLDVLMEDVADLEVMLSLKNIGMDLEHSCIPGSKKTIIGRGLVHPLVKGCIPNDFSLAGGVILTGSNMSGKTTFMRTLGINQVLFNACGLCAAEEFESIRIPVHTSLRANDMLAEGVSTFYAEISRMKAIHEAAEKGPVLVLIDEIFKGTNAKDRIYASEKVISSLLEQKALFIISTHDFELCDAEGIKNYHFEDSYTEDDKISFDYKIREGRCNTTNAIRLLEMSGII